MKARMAAATIRALVTQSLNFVSIGLLALLDHVAHRPFVTHLFSFLQRDLQHLRAWQALGKPSFGASSAEAGSLRLRRSLYVVEDMKAGDVLTSKNLRAIRPGDGLPTRELPLLLGQRVQRDVARGTPASWSLLMGTTHTPRDINSQA